MMGHFGNKEDAPPIGEGKPGRKENARPREEDAHQL